MWEIDGKSVDPQRFMPFKPLRVLNDYDGPRIFTFLDSDEALCLACWSDEDENHARFLVVAINDLILLQLETGMLSVREALAQPRLWVVDWAHDGNASHAWLVRPQSIPEDAQPQPRTMLYRSLDPLLSLRATGDTIRAGEIPGSVIKGTVEGAQRAIKCLAEYEMELPARRGRPSRALQKLYDLPVQRTLAASFEVQFRSPLSEPNLFEGLAETEIREEHQVLNTVTDHLKTGLNWLTQAPADASTLPVPENTELSRAIITALKYLAPSPTSPVQVMEIRGGFSTPSRQPIQLSHRSRNILNKALARNPDLKERRIELTGRIRELNERLKRFELHTGDHPGSVIRVCEFEPDYWDIVYESLGNAETVLLVGIETSPTSNLRVVDLTRSVRNDPLEQSRSDVPHG